MLAHSLFYPYTVPVPELTPQSDRITIAGHQGQLRTLSYSVFASQETPIFLTGVNGIPNWVIGGKGNDTLIGGDRRDTLNGGDGNDYLDGGIGSDMLLGGRGDDTYYIDNVNDLAIEYRGQGYDVAVVSAEKWAIKGSSIEAAYLVGAGVELIGGNGNELLVGNSLDNLLSGVWGKDTLIGGDGADTLRGGGDSDTLTGGNGRDRFLIEHDLSHPSYRNAFDTITDFTPGEDTIIVQADPRISFSYSIVQSDAEAAIAIGTVVYSLGSGNLYYNPNGTAEGFTLLTGSLSNRLIQYGGLIANTAIAPLESDISFSPSF
jgi:Ca2+-binding RTX toxin-like protein